MAVKLNDRGYDFAKGLVAARRVATDDRDAWSEDQRTAERREPDGWVRTPPLIAEH